MRRRRWAGHHLIAHRFAYGPFAALQLVGFAVRLDQLQPDDCPKYLAKCLKYAPKEAQTEGVSNTLLEVFDKVG